MPAVLIGRTAMVDDDGSGQTGTVFNNAWKTALYVEIDAALAQLLPLSGGTMTGDLVARGLTVGAGVAAADASSNAVKPTVLVIAVDGVAKLGTTANGGLVSVFDSSAGSGGLFMMRGGNAAVFEISDGDAAFATTKDTATSTNLYHDAAGPSGAGYYIQNKQAASRNYYVTRIGQ